MRLPESWAAVARSNLLLGAAALLAGVAAYVLARHYLGTQAQQLQQHYALQVQTRSVLVASRALAGDETLGQAQLARREVPLRYLPENVLTPTEASQVIGRRLLHPVAAGQALTDADLAPRQPTSLVGLLPPGQRAVTVAVDEVAGQAGLLRAGDQVDLYWHGAVGNGAATQVRRLLQAVPVLARGTRLAGGPQAGSGEGADTLTLQVSRMTRRVWFWRSTPASWWRCRDRLAMPSQAHLACSNCASCSRTRPLSTALRVCPIPHCRSSWVAAAP